MFWLVMDNVVTHIENSVWVSTVVPAALSHCYCTLRKERCGISIETPQQHMLSYNQNEMFHIWRRVDPLILRQSTVYSTLNNSNKKCKTFKKGK